MVLDQFGDGRSVAVGGANDDLDEFDVSSRHSAIRTVGCEVVRQS
ncbi:hypothetical protein [Haloarcula pellucida]|nr:hypothetical protein [Halomicroarcula pellucida]